MYPHLRELKTIPGIAADQVAANRITKTNPQIKKDKEVRISRNLQGIKHRKG